MRLIDADKFREYCIHKLNFFPAMIDRALENQPTIETIPKGLYDQIKCDEYPTKYENYKYCGCCGARITTE